MPFNYEKIRTYLCTRVFCRLPKAKVVERFSILITGFHKVESVSREKKIFSNEEITCTATAVMTVGIGIATPASL